MAAPAIISATTASTTEGGAFGYQIIAINSPASYSATNLPAWASLNTASGYITGTPNAAGLTNVTIKATNAGGTGSANLAITVNNAPPAFNSLAITPLINQNDVATLSGTFSDPGTLETFTLKVDWGDGSALQNFPYPAGSNSFSQTHRYLGSPPGTKSGVYIPALTLTDNYGGSANAIQLIVVNNVPPTLSNVAITKPINENDLATLSGTFSDPGTLDTFTLQVDWGDGSAPQAYPYAAGSRSFSQAHRYLNNPSGTVPGTYTVNVTLTDNSGDADSVSLPIVVDNVPPALTGVTFSPMILENQSITLTGAFTDPGTLDTHLVLIDWGDGQQDTLNLLAQVLAIGPISHKYLKSNPSPGYSITVTVSDYDGGSDSVVEWVSVVNVPPVPAIVGAPATVAEGTSISLTSTVSDPGSLDTFTYSWLVVKDGLPYAIGAADGFYFTPNDQGTYVVTLIVTDENGGMGIDHVTISVTNVPPAAAILGAPASSPEGTPIVLTYAVIDPGSADTFTYSWSVAKDGNPYASGTAADITFTPDDNASYVVSLAVTDKDGGVGFAPDQTMAVTNVSPTASIADAPVTSPEGTPINLTSVVTDPGTLDTFTYAWSVMKDGNPYASGTDAAFTFTPDDNASLVVSLTVTDKDGGVGVAADQTIAVTNVVPAAAIAGAPVTSPEGTPIALTSTVTDPGILDTFTYAWSVTKDGNSYTSGTGAAFTFTPDDNATYVVSLAVTDKDGGVGVAPDQTIAVSNVPPAAAIIGAPAASPEGTPIALTCAVADPGILDTFTYLWIVTKDAKPFAIGIAAAFSFTPDDNATYVVSLTVTDKDGGVGVAGDQTITVTNAAPTVAIVGAPANSAEGTPIALTSTVTDPGILDAFTYAWSVTKDGNSYTSGTGAAFTFTPDDNATYVVSLAVTDKDGGVGVAPDQTITVTNVPPTAAIAGAPASSPEGTPIALTSTVTDPGILDTFTYAWSVTKDGNPYASGTDAAFTFTPDDNASFVVSLTVTDKDGGMGTDTKTITATNVNPVAAIVGAQVTSPEGTPIALTCTVADPGVLDTFTYAWSVTKDGVLFATGSTPSFSFRPDDHGLYAITLTATDKDGGSASDTKTIVVLNSAPSVVIEGAPASVRAGTTVNLTSVVTDAGEADTFTYAWQLTKEGLPCAAGTAAEFSFTPSDDAVYAVTLTVTDDGGATASDSKIIISQAPPVILSGPTADINPAKPLQVVHFFCQAYDDDAITWKWDFGDGTSDTSSSSVQHAFTPAGTYTVTVTATDANGLATVKTLTMMIDPTGGAAVPPGTEIDSDGDGFSDVLEAALGSDPMNAGSTPFGSAPAGPPQPISIKSTALRLHFDEPGHDTIVVTGVLPLRVGLVLAGQRVAVDVGGVIKAFTLDNRGVSSQGRYYFRLAMKVKRGVVAEPRARFRLQLSHGSFASTLARDGFTASPHVVSAVRQVLVTILLDQTLYQQVRDVFWTCRNEVLGAGR